MLVDFWTLVREDLVGLNKIFEFCWMLWTDAGSQWKPCDWSTISSPIVEGELIGPLTASLSKIGTSLWASIMQKCPFFLDAHSFTHTHTQSHICICMYVYIGVMAKAFLRWESSFLVVLEQDSAYATRYFCASEVIYFKPKLSEQ